MITPTLRLAEEAGFPETEEHPAISEQTGVSVLRTVLTLCLFPKITLDPRSRFLAFCFSQTEVV